MTSPEQYRALKERAAIGAIAPRSVIAVRGKDRLTFLHGLLTNDVSALVAGMGCYAAWLTPQGRMLTDVHLFETGDEVLLDLPADLVWRILKRLDQSVFSEDVQLEGLADLQPVWIHGPLAAAALERLFTTSALGSWREYRNVRFEFRGARVTVARVSQIGVPGFCVYADAALVPDLRRALEASGAMPADSHSLEAARIEAGYPVFGVDMTDDTIPLEAGIEDRAISFTKGCYVGQEVIVRVLHRGQGRVARKLVGLRIEGDVPAASTKIVSGEREVGWVTSAAMSPQLGSIAMGYVQRDFVSPGSRVELEMPPGRVTAVVTERPFPQGAR